MKRLIAWELITCWFSLTDSDKAINPSGCRIRAVGKTVFIDVHAKRVFKIVQKMIYVLKNSSVASTHIEFALYRGVDFLQNLARRTPVRCINEM